LLRQQIPSRFILTPIGNDTLRIQELNSGFNLTGSSTTGVTQLAQHAGTVTRTTTPKTTGGTPIQFVGADANTIAASVTLLGTVTAGDVWTVTINDGSAHPYPFNVTTATRTAVAQGLAGLIPAATFSGDTLQLRGTTPFTVTVAVAGPAPVTTVSFFGTP